MALREPAELAECPALAGTVEIASMSVGPRTLGEVTDYQSLLKVMRERADELQISRGSDANAELAGLGDRYLIKISGRGHRAGSA